MEKAPGSIRLARVAGCVAAISFAVAIASVVGLAAVAVFQPHLGPRIPVRPVIYLSLGPLAVGVLAFGLALPLLRCSSCGFAPFQAPALGPASPRHLSVLRTFYTLGRLGTYTCPRCGAEHRALQRAA